MKINPMTYVNINNKTKVKIVENFFYVIRWRALFNFIFFIFFGNAIFLQTHMNFQWIHFNVYQSHS